MKSPLNYYVVLVKRWAWLVILGVIVCSATTFIVSRAIPPTYQASSTVMLNIDTSTSSYDNFNASVQSIPTYVQLFTNPSVLQRVVDQHPGLTLNQLASMLSVKPLPNTQLIEVDVQSSDPKLATQLANEVGQSFAQFANEQLSGTIQVIPGQQPADPIHPKPLLYTGIAAAVGLALALALIIIFEWVDDPVTSVEEVQKLIGADLLTVIPRLSRKQRARARRVEEVAALAEGCRMLSFNLSLEQTVNPFKQVVVTSVLAGEGKSTVAAHLAVFLANTGKRVLLVDANMRRPVLDQYFQLEKGLGLVDLLLKNGEPVDEKMKSWTTNIAGLHALTTEVSLLNTADLLQTQGIDRLFDYFNKAPFDYILFDTPPLLPVVDAQILAARAHMTVLVVDASKTPRKMLVHAGQVLARSRATTLGIVINKSQWSDYNAMLQYPQDNRRSKQRSDQQINAASDSTASLPAISPANDLVDPYAGSLNVTKDTMLPLPAVHNAQRGKKTS